MSARLTDRERMLRSISEKDWQRDVLKLARSTGWTHYHTYRATRSPAGFPDLVMWKPGQLIFVELKRETGVLSAEQVRILAGIEDGGGRVYVWRPSDLDEAVEILTFRGRV